MRAGAYLSSWGKWAAEKRQKGWKADAGGNHVGDEDARPTVTTVSELAREEVHNTTATSDVTQSKEMNEKDRLGDEGPAG